MNPHTDDHVVVTAPDGVTSRFLVRVVTSHQAVISPVDNLDELSTISKNPQTNQWQVDGTNIDYNLDFVRPPIAIKLDAFGHSLYVDIVDVVGGNNFDEADTILSEHRRNMLASEVLDPGDDGQPYWFYREMIARSTDEYENLAQKLDWLLDNNAIAGGWLFLASLRAGRIDDIINWMVHHDISAVHDPVYDDNEQFIDYMTDTIKDVVFDQNNLELFTTLHRVPGLFDYINENRGYVNVSWIDQMINEFDRDEMRARWQAPPTKAVRKS